MCIIFLLESGLIPWRQGFLRAHLIEVLKVLRSFENVDSEKFFQVAGEDGKRGHRFKLLKLRYRLDVRRFRFCESGLSGIEQVG